MSLEGVPRGTFTVPDRESVGWHIGYDPGLNIGGEKGGGSPGHEPGRAGPGVSERGAACFGAGQSRGVQQQTCVLVVW